MAEETNQAPTSEASATSPPPNFANLLSDPAMIARLGAIMSALQNNGGQSSTTAPPPTDGTAASAAQPSDGLAKILSDPALLEKLPQIMAVMKPLLAADAPAKPPEESAAPASVTLHSHAKDRDNLLLAIKPFLSSGRRDAVDTILRVEKLGEFLKQMK